ncbi:unnamed protein product, partial [Symbiodinium sp. KB8]
ACKVVLLMGPPGSGKSTLGDVLANRFHGVHIDLGRTMRSDPDEIKSPQAMMMNAILAEMEVGQQKLEAGDGPHLVFVNGFPRKDDGYHFWNGLDAVPKPSLCLVLEAPDDVLRARAEQRSRAPHDLEEKFDDRLEYFRKETAKVVNNFHDTGRTRYIDATGSPSLMESAAARHMRPTLVFACGKPELLEALSGSLAEPRLRISEVCLPSATSEQAAQSLRQQLRVRGYLGQLVLVEGFPRTDADMQAWTGIEPAPLLTLDFDSGLHLSGSFVRSFSDASASTVEAVTKLLRSCQPLHAAVPEASVLLLKHWLGAARYTKWWDPSTFEASKTTYLAYMKSQVSAHNTYDPSYYIRPSSSPPLKAWLCWLAHLLYAEPYQNFCTTVLKRSVGPLAPPSSAGYTKAGRAPFTESDVQAQRGVKSKVAVPSDALAGVPLAFVDGLAALEAAGLAPLSDPRALIFGMEQDGANAASRIMELLGLYYRRFLIVMGEAGPESKAGPSPEIDWIWHAHTTHAMIYGDDCRHLFGHVIPHVPCKPSQSSPKPAVPAVPDSGQLAMSELTRMAFAAEGSEQLATASSWPFRRDPAEEDDAITLGCFISGGDRSWLSERLRSVGGTLGQALWHSMQAPEDWSCPNPSTSSMLRDPDLVEVIVRLLSGETLLEKVMAKDTKILDIEVLLREKGEKEDLKFFVDGEELARTRLLAETAVMEGSVISLVRVKKPPPKPRPKPVAVARAWSPDSVRCTCFTDSCVFHVLKSGRQVQKSMRQLKEGDMLHTGSPVREEQFRRVTRIWQCPTLGESATVEVLPGCRLTTGHPVKMGGTWRRPESCGEVELTHDRQVYTIELEGHVDTVLVGRSMQEAVVVAALGVYCGESFGWNLFTRKTRPCEQPNCAKCAVAVVPSLDFRNVTSDMMAVRPGWAAVEGGGDWNVPGAHVGGIRETDQMKLKFYELAVQDFSAHFKKVVKYPIFLQWHNEPATHLEEDVSMANSHFALALVVMPLLTVVAIVLLNGLLQLLVWFQLAGPHRPPTSESAVVGRLGLVLRNRDLFLCMLVFRMSRKFYLELF